MNKNTHAESNICYIVKRLSVSSITLFVLNGDVIGARDLLCGDFIGGSQKNLHSGSGPPKPFYYYSSKGAGASKYIFLKLQF